MTPLRFRWLPFVERFDWTGSGVGDMPDATGVGIAIGWGWWHLELIVARSDEARR